VTPIADRLYVLEPGCIVAAGTVEEVGGADAVANRYLALR
jgi:ABC-type branched-subunit amino acid transport system ATPase component